MTIEKIVLVGPAYPLRGGIAHFNESFARSLALLGIVTEIMSFSLQYPEILFPGKSQFSDSEGPTDLIIHKDISSINPNTWYKSARKIIALKPDVVVIRYWHPFMAPSLGTIAKKLSKSGIKVIGLVDNAIPHEPKFYDKAFLKYFAKNCSAFFTLSKSVSEDIKSLGLNKPCETSPHPLYDIFGESVTRQEARTYLKLQKDDEILLFFGFIRPYKGLDLLLNALADKRLNRKNLKLIVAGEFYESEDKYRSIVKENGLDQKVIFESEYIPDDRVKYYFAAANLVAQTYKTATQSGVTQIAYHFNKPMLVTDVGGLSEIVVNGETGYVVDRDSGAIASAINRYFTDLCEEDFTKAVTKKKHEFSWEYFTQKFINFSEEL